MAKTGNETAIPLPFIVMTSRVVKVPNAVPASGVAWLAENFWLVAMALLVIRLFLCAACNLVPDEAFYWTWTRHLSTGYFDHPPMIAWVIWLSTRLSGNTALGVRFPAAVFSIGSLAVLYGVAKRVLRDTRAVGFVILMWIAGPLLPVIGTIMTPDAPAAFFSVCAMAFAVRVAEDDEKVVRESGLCSTGTGSPRHFVLFGLFCGLALLSKYTTVLVPVGVGLSLLTSRRGRRHFARPWVYLSGLVALAVFSPCIYWNYKHHWASFLFQINHGTGRASEGLHGFLPRAASIAEFLGGQAAVWTPILFVMAILVLAVNWGKFGKLWGVDRLLLWSGTLPLVFFGAMSLRTHGEVNWPAFAYFPISLLVARYLAEQWQGKRVQWIRAGCAVAVGFSLGIHVLAVPGVQNWLLKFRVPEAIVSKLPPNSTMRRRLVEFRIPLTHQITDLWGWQRFGQQLGKIAEGMPVVCNRHQDAGEAAFYMPGQPEVWCDGIDFRETAFDYFDTGRPNYEQLPQVLFVSDNPRHVNDFMKKWKYTQKLDIDKIVMRGLGKNRSHTVTRLGR